MRATLELNFGRLKPGESKDVAVPLMFNPCMIVMIRTAPSLNSGGYRIDIYDNSQAPDERNLIYSTGSITGAKRIPELIPGDNWGQAEGVMALPYSDYQFDAVGQGGLGVAKLYARGRNGSHKAMYLSAWVTVDYPFNVSTGDLVLDEENILPMTKWTVDEDVVTFGEFDAATVVSNKGGEGYKVGDTLYVHQAGASGMRLKVATVNAGAVATVAVVNAGMGYREAEALTTTSPEGGTGCEVALSADDLTPVGVAFYGSTGTGTLTQAEEDFVNDIVPGQLYSVSYYIDNLVGDVNLVLSAIGGIPAEAVPLPVNYGWNVGYFRAFASGDFILEFSGAEGSQARIACVLLAPVALGNIETGSINFNPTSDGAGTETGTLTNAPTAGDPAKWIPVNVNGTKLFIPAWAAPVEE